MFVIFFCVFIQIYPLTLEIYLIFFKYFVLTNGFVLFVYSIHLEKKKIMTYIP